MRAWQRVRSPRICRSSWPRRIVATRARVEQHGSSPSARPQARKTRTRPHRKSGPRLFGGRHSGSAMPAATICLDCNALYTSDSTTRTYSRCPGCRPAYLKRQAARPGRHARRQTPERAAAQSFYDSHAWKKARAVVRQRDGGCTRCGNTSDLTVHHILSRKTHPHLELDYDNLTTLCRSCHGSLENSKRARR